MLDDARIEFRKPAFLRLSFGIQIFDDDGLRARDRQPDIGQAQASLFGHFPVLAAPCDVGIDERREAAADARDADAMTEADLRRGDAEPIRGNHRILHVFDQLQDFFGDFLNFLRFGPKNGSVCAGDNGEGGDEGSL